jgi:hypothetical protein
MPLPLLARVRTTLPVVALALGALAAACADDGKASDRRRAERLERARLASERPDSAARLSGRSTSISAPDTSFLPLDVLAADATIQITDEAGRRTNSIESAAEQLEEIPGSYGFTDVARGEGADTVATSTGATVGVPARPGARYRVEVIPAYSGLDSVLVQMPVGSGVNYRFEYVPFHGRARVPVRFDVSIGAVDYRVGPATVGGT